MRELQIEDAVVMRVASRRGDRAQRRVPLRPSPLRPAASGHWTVVSAGGRVIRRKCHHCTALGSALQEQGGLEALWIRTPRECSMRNSGGLFQKHICAKVLMISSCLPHSGMARCSQVLFEHARTADATRWCWSMWQMSKNSGKWAFGCASVSLKSLQALTRKNRLLAKRLRRLARHVDGD